VKDMSEEVWDRTIDVNLKGIFLCCKAVIEPMMAQRGGKIINITSGRGVAGQFKAASYSASKGGVIGFTKSLALEVASFGINVNALAPGATDTDMWRDGKSNEEIEELLKVPPLLQGIGKPEDVIGTVIYLISDASKNVTGQVIFMKTP
jgi:NAD(P)-dependent dehydrogenase (short-subunit alcohol dehydrogenase family)